MKYLALIICAVLFAACSSSVSGTKDPITQTELPITQPASGVVCGGMMAGASQGCAGENEYCHREIKDLCGAADAPGVCKERPQMCTMDYSPVCGCDDETYPNECAANAKGISAAHTGECK